MGGTIIGYCAECDCQIDYDPLQGGKQYCDDCLSDHDCHSGPESGCDSGKYRPDPDILYDQMRDDEAERQMEKEKGLSRKL